MSTKRPAQPIDHDRPAVVKEGKAMADAIASFLSTRKKAILAPLLAGYKGGGKALTIDPDEVDRLLDLLSTTPWEDLPAELKPYLQAIYTDGMVTGFAQVGADIENLLSLVPDAAVKFAQERGAELVGMKWVDGELVTNPRAEWAISDSTRELIRGDVTQAMEEGWSGKRLSDALEDSAAFSESRADMVARTECAFADASANQEAWAESGLVKEKQWLTAQDPCDLCIGNADQGPIPFDDDFESGDASEPGHVNCFCVTVPIVEE